MGYFVLVSDVKGNFLLLSSLFLRYIVNIWTFCLIFQDNYDHRIIECLTPEGEIAPYQSLETLWKFSPIEARSYTVRYNIFIYF